MGVYLNQLPPTEVARLKAELAETLIANFCYPRFYDYRINALRTRPVDRSKRQEVWQYLNAVDFNVWGRVDVDSPDFQHQVERLFIHFVQRNRNFFGAQGRRRMADVRSLITNCSLVLAEGMRKHLQGKPGNAPLGSPRPVFSWAAVAGSKQTELAWDDILSNTMQLQQQLQEVRGEVRLASAPIAAVHPENAANAPARRPRPTRPSARDVTSTEGRDGEALTWPPPESKPVKVGDGRFSVSFPATAKEPTPPYLAGASTADATATPTLPLPLGKPESVPPTVAPTRVFSEVSARPKRPKADTSPSVLSAKPLSKSLSQSLPAVTGNLSAPKLPTVAPVLPGAGLAVKQSEQATVVMDDEDVVIFEQMRYQLVVELRVEAVRAGIELNGQGAFQLVEVLRHQNDMDLARLQVISTLLNTCDQIITSGHATLLDYKQAMMFYLMHTRHSH
jgi:hypothetical protein